MKFKLVKKPNSDAMLYHPPHFLSSFGTGTGRDIAVMQCFVIVTYSSTAPAPLTHHIFVYSEKAGRQTASPQETVIV